MTASNTNPPSADAASAEAKSGEQPTHPPDHPQDRPALFVFVNRRRFDESDGVRPTMTGADIAALVNVPADRAVVRRETGPDPRPIELTETVAIHQADHFLVTRRTVEGGHGR